VALLTSIRIDAQDSQLALADPLKTTDAATSAVRTLLKSAALTKQVQRVHEKLGHIDLKRIFKFKRHSKVVCANLPSKFLKAYRQACPICLATKRRRRSLPKTVANRPRWLFSSLGRSRTSKSAAPGAFLRAVVTATTACLFAASEAPRCLFLTVRSPVFSRHMSSSSHELAATPRPPLHGLRRWALKLRV
jgi:hypothetical protein